MSKNIFINKEEFKVCENEFSKIQHDEFNNLHILDSLGEIERIISLLTEITFIENNKYFNLICEGLSVGGYIPIKCSNFYNEIQIFNFNDIQKNNILFNMDNYNIKNIILNNKIINNNIPYILFINEDNKLDLSIYDPEFLICNENLSFNKENYFKYKISNSELVIYIKNIFHEKFYKEFHYFIKNNILDYDNLIHFTMIVKNAGDSFEDILNKNLSIIDRWTILDTGSTDNTIDIINKVLVGKKKGKLYQEPFINFRDSRNRCIDLAGKCCKYLIMLDDTYIVEGGLREFLNVVRGDQFSDSFSMYIKSNDTEYGSNRIIKTKSELRYKYKLHEVITPVNNNNVIIPINCSYIFDYRSDYMENRTMERKQYDLKILFEMVEEEPYDSRALYYIAQTYNLLEKYELALEYFLKRVNHPDEGFIQEKICACFEAARLCNFKLNKNWEECEFLYLKAYEMDKSRPDSLYFIGIHYYLQGKNNIDIDTNLYKAYTYFKKGYEVGYPSHCQYSLKPTLSFYYLPKFLSELCYLFKDSVTGENCSQLFLDKNSEKNSTENDYKVVKSWNSIFKCLNIIPPIPEIIKQSSKPYLCFVVDGGFEPWTGRDILNKGMGGSETYVIETARYIQKSGYFQVVVFCNCIKNDIFEGVEYRQFLEHFSFFAENYVHTCIISRYSEYLPVAIKCNVENIYLIAHDLNFTGIIIPRSKSLKKIFCLSEWHVDFFTNIFTTLKDIVEPFYLGIDFKLFNNSVKKIPYKFIYSSFPNRGLLPLLQMWPKILNKYPESILHIHSDVDGKWVNNVVPSEIVRIKEILDIYKNDEKINLSIFYYGWTNKKILYSNWDSADIWFYPCTFLETFCHTALEAAASKTLIVTSKLGALKNIVSDRGILLEGDFYNEQFQNQALIELFKIIDNKELKNKLINDNYNWVKKLSWENRVNELLNLYLIPTLPSNNTSIIKNIDSRLEYRGMYNWTNDIPENSLNIFLHIIEYIKSKSKNTEIKILEIGTYTGTSLIKFLELIPNSISTAIDTWKNYDENNSEILNKIEENNIEEIFYNNIKNANVEKRVRVIKSDSFNILLNLIKNNEYFDFIYVDGSHKLLDCYSDLLLSFNLIKSGGIIGIDDYYLFKDNTFESPFEAINKFIEKFEDKIKILSRDYRVFIEKI